LASEQTRKFNEPKEEPSFSGSEVCGDNLGGIISFELCFTLSRRHSSTPDLAIVKIGRMLFSIATCLESAETIVFLGSGTVLQVVLQF